jgi:hypothetical protein
MLVFGGTDYMSDDQFDRWCALLNRLAHLESANPGTYIFHGTSEAVAKKITDGGFEPQWVTYAGHDVERNESGEALGIYWGNLYWAKLFAERRSQGRATGFPVIIVARLTDVLAAGTPIPDLIALEDAGYPTTCGWQESLKHVGAMVSVNCRRVAGIRTATAAAPGELLACADDDYEMLLHVKNSRDQNAVNQRFSRPRRGPQGAAWQEAADGHH